MKEEKFPHTRKTLHWRRRGGAGGSFRATEESTATGCRGQSGEIPAQRIGADQHSAAREACLLPRPGAGGGWEMRPGAGTDALRRPTCRGGAKTKAEAQELCEQRRERETSPSSLRSSRLNPNNQLDVPASVEYRNRQRIVPKLRQWTWEKL